MPWSGIRLRVSFEDDAEPLEREPLVVVVDRRAVRHHDRGAPPGRDDRCRTELLLDPLHDPVHLRRRSEHEAGLDGLDGAGIADLFRFIVAAGDTDASKPAPDPYLRAAELHGVPAAACVAIEDSKWGLQSARAAGMPTIGITHTYPRAELTDADVVVDSLDELTIDFLLTLPPAIRSEAR